MKKMVLAIAASAALSISAPTVSYAQTAEAAPTVAGGTLGAVAVGALALAAVIAIGDSGSSSAPAGTTTTTTTTTTN